jgi:lysophospholipase L1-like esterase
MEAFPLREGLALEVYARKEPSSGQMRELQLALPAGSRLLGVELLTGRPGVVYDELGLNGAELTDLERWNPALRGALLAGTKPDLIVLAYGTNDMGMAVSAQPGYEQRVEKLLQAFRRDSGAPILVVGPLDRLGKRRRQRAALAAGADWIIRTLAQASRETGCAFWDARGAMGGYGAILKWRRAGLAQADLVHLNGAGYQKLGDLMTDALLKILR